MMTGFFKNRVLAWSREEGGAAPVLVQVGARGVGRLPPALLAAVRACCPNMRATLEQLSTLPLPAWLACRRRWATRTAMAATGAPAGW